MGRKARWEYFRVIYGRYLKADRKAKREMLNEFCLTTGDSVNLIWPTSITYLATPWVNQLPHPGRSEALRRP